MAKRIVNLEFHYFPLEVRRRHMELLSQRALSFPTSKERVPVMVDSDRPGYLTILDEVRRPGYEFLGAENSGLSEVDLRQIEWVKKNYFSVRQPGQRTSRAAGRGTYKGIEVEVVNRGTKNIRVKLADGSTKLVPRAQFTEL